MRTRRVHLAWMALAVAACSSSDDGARSAACLAQDRALQQVVETTRGGAPNVLVAVKNEACGTSVYLSGDKATATPDSLWRIMSVTKTFTSAAVLSLVEDGALAVDDPLARWVPDVAGSSGVTLEMLLDHRSGMNWFDPTRPELADGCTPREIIDDATSRGAFFPPDEGFQYSDTNYTLLGMVLEAVTGRSAASVVRERAVARAGLANTFFDGADAFAPEALARGCHGFCTYDKTFSIPPSCLWTGAAIVASGADLAEWVATLYGSDAVLGSTGHALQTARTSSFGNPYPYVHYGLGVMLVDPSAWLPLTPRVGTGMGHIGAGPGYLTLAVYFPDQKAAVVTMVNDDTRWESVLMPAEKAALIALFP